MQPHIDYMRSLAAQFSGETDVSLSTLGVVSDNPSSAEAIYAATEPLVIRAQDLNETNGQALRNVALMALAVVHETDYQSERAKGITIDCRWRNPAMPSIVSQSDAMVKQISAINWIGETDVALEELGYSDEQIKRMQTQKRRIQALQNYTTSTQARQAQADADQAV